MVEQRTIDLSAIKDPAALEIIKFLLERVRLLEEEVAQLKRNSSNSSKPPSSDITKPSNEQRRPGERKIGAQARHPGKQREMLPAEKVDKRVPLTIDTCPDCGHELEVPQEADELVSQTVELKEKPIEVIEYHRLGCWCSRILTVIATCRKQERSAWEFIHQAVIAKNFGSKVPSLLPI